MFKSDYQPTTQKARGILAINEEYEDHRIYVHGVFPVNQPLHWTLWPFFEAIFARPCPPRPEHGFVESRLIKDLAGLEALRQEVLAVNDQSEIIIMDWQESTRNMIWTPRMVTIGAGHDGATSGSNVTSFPLSGINSLSPLLLLDAGVSPGADPYVEAVLPKGSANPHLTQLRSGPRLTSIDPDFVPEQIEVTAVIRPAGEDLLSWATKVKSLTPGTVVYHPGGSLTDHYAVHCRESGIPIMITREPLIGEILAPRTIEAADPAAMMLGIAAGEIYRTDHPDQAVTLALMALHNSAVLRGAYAYWIGAATAIILRYGSMAMRGEARHAHGRNANNKPTRETVYDRYADRSLTFHRAGLSRVTQVLTYGFGDPMDHHSFGGKKWGLCGAALVPLFNAVRSLFLDPSPETASEVTLALNIAINQAHNGGWWLNKFVTDDVYADVPRNDLLTILTGSLAAYDLDQLRSAAQDHLPLLTKQVRRWPVSVIAPLKWRRVTLDIVPGAFILKFKATVIRTPQQLTVPISPTVAKALTSTSGHVQLGNDQVRVLLPGQNPVTIWKGVELVAKARKHGDSV